MLNMQRHRKMKIYISGPMTDRATGRVSKANIEAFYQAERQLREAGYTQIVNPARVWACRFPWLYKIVGYRLTLWYDLQLLKRCHAICLLSGWEDSTGVYAEFSLAFRRDLFVLPINALAQGPQDIHYFLALWIKTTWKQNR
jgi:hypothetical protein